MLVGRFSKSKTDMNKLIKDNGGAVTSSLNPERITHFVSTKASLKSPTKQLAEILELKLPVYSEDFLFDWIKEKQIPRSSEKYLIAGSLTTPRPKLGSLSPKRNQKDKEEETISLSVNGIPVVDPKSKLTGTILQDTEHSTWYSVTLTMTDISRNLNTYYILQVC
jgi:hypothetical protein